MSSFCFSEGIFKPKIKIWIQRRALDFDTAQRKFPLVPKISPLYSPPCKYSTAFLSIKNFSKRTPPKDGLPQPLQCYHTHALGNIAKKNRRKRAKTANNDRFTQIDITVYAMKNKLSQGKRTHSLGFKYPQLFYTKYVQ